MPSARSAKPDVNRLLVAHASSAVALGLPWPALLVAVWDDTHSATWLGVAGAARMAPYVALSWLAGRLADRFPRRRIVVLSLASRIVLLAGSAVALASGEVAISVVLASCAVAAGTPAYPALAAEMPALAGDRNEAATGLLVTCEVAAFFVGPAVGGLLLGADASLSACSVAIFATAYAFRLVVRARWVLPPTAPQQQRPADGDRGRVLGVLRDSRSVAAMLALVGNNLIGGTLAIALFPLARESWSDGGRAFGVATAAVGLGAFAVPLLLRQKGLSGVVGRCGAVVMALALATVVLAPDVGWAVVPLAVAGACTVYVEAVATGVLQQLAPDSSRSSVLGLADSLMVAAAALGSALAPWLASSLGSRTVVLGCAAGSVCLVGLLPSTRALTVAAARLPRPRLDETVLHPAASVGASD